MRFQLPEKMREAKVDAMSIQGQSFEIDDDGQFDAPDHFIDHVRHLGITIVVPPKEAPSKKGIAKAGDIQKD